MMVDDVVMMDKKRKDRRDETAEVFTPFSLCRIMANMMPKEMWSDPTKTFLDNSCGNGQILLYVIDRKLDNGSTYEQALSTTYGLDLMQDNVDECKLRIKQLLNKRGIQYDIKKVNAILDENIRCHDALNGWDYDNWCPLPEPDDGKSYELF